MAGPGPATHGLTVQDAARRACPHRPFARRALADYAAAQGGRFLLFGSAARSTMRYDSGVDILEDFPADQLDAAWNFAERACWERDLDPDVLPFAWCKGRFLERITPDLQVVA